MLLAQAGKRGAPTAEQAWASAQQIKEWQATLRDPDATVRLSALNNLLNSDDPALREIAYEAGFASADRNMRALVLRTRVLTAKSLVFELEPLANATPAELQFIKAQGAQASTFLVEPDPKSGEFRTRWGPARVAGTGLSIQGACNGRLELGDGAVLAGNVSCGPNRSRWSTRLN